MKAVLGQVPFLLVVFLALPGCGPQLEYGSYDAALSGTMTTFSGAESAWASDVEIDIAYGKDRGVLTYQATFCRGFVDYFSAGPCFNTMTITDTTDGLIGLQEEAWNLIINGADGESAACTGTEEISFAGDLTSDQGADIEVTYHLNLDNSSAAACKDFLAQVETRVVTSGTLTLVSP